MLDYSHFSPNKTNSGVDGDGVDSTPNGSGSHR
jgi:hypothetical protein